ncbi:MAG: PQQ-dependent sugar dehydrogenase [Tahibacter sp.]
MRFLAIISLLGLTFASMQATAALPADLALTPIPGTYSSPVALRAPRDGSGRLFIVQKGGSIRIVKNGALLTTPFLTVSVTTASESGLLGLAFHPNYGKVGLPHSDEFYVAYTQPSAAPRLGATPDQVIARYTVSANPDVANTSGTIVMRVPDLAGNHNGGDIHFGADGYLYSSMGDSGAQDNPYHFAECLWKKIDTSGSTCTETVGSTNYFLLGKILRIDVDNRGSAPTADMCGSSGINPAQYSIPASNPHVATTNTCDEIWDHGFRNPWRFSFDRQTHDLIIGDVGQGSWEEVDFHPTGTAGGRDYGWSRCEGRHYKDTAGSGTTCPATTSTFAPVIEYGHGANCAITGGYVYRGPIGVMRGTYFYGDSCSGILWYANATGATWDAGGQLNTGLPPAAIYGFGEDEAGNLYVTYAGGTVSKLTSDILFSDGFQL